jgi:hypothetical protein
MMKLIVVAFGDEPNSSHRFSVSAASLAQRRVILDFCVETWNCSWSAAGTNGVQTERIGTSTAR